MGVFLLLQIKISFFENHCIAAMIGKKVIFDERQNFALDKLIMIIIREVLANLVSDRLF